MDQDRALAKLRRDYAKTAEFATEHGWEISHEIDKERLFLSISVVRGGESIKIWWVEAKLTEAPVYTYGGIETKLRNHSAVLGQMASRPNVNRVKRRARAASRLGGEPLELIEIVKALPWDPDQMDDIELKRACYGRTLVWLNSITGLPERDAIWYPTKTGPKSGPNWNAANYKITRSKAGRRIITFVGMTGYRSVGVDALLQVV